MAPIDLTLIDNVAYIFNAEGTSVRHFWYTKTVKI